MIFASQMLLATQLGFTWTRSDYRAWLSEAGFKEVEFVATPTPATMAFAR